MRLLNVQSMQLEEYFGHAVPDYAILSHCWGAEEVTLQDMDDLEWRTMPGAFKITLASQYCQTDAIDYIWIDTCCIDKTSSAELSEAINSMFSWYEKAECCYVYLEDFTRPQHGIVATSSIEIKLPECRWFTRGWTLQELIAPQIIYFFDKDWKYIGTKEMLASELSRITKIPQNVLINPSQRHSCSVARKMSWAAKRRTTRVEDVAYSLLGIFDVNMPLLYGEGRRAFIRLQEEILKETDDQSLFAWGVMIRPDEYVPEFIGVLAESPAHFLHSANVVPSPSGPESQPYEMTNKGLRIELPVWRFSDGDMHYEVAMLSCHFENDKSKNLGIALVSIPESNILMRRPGYGVRAYSATSFQNSQTRRIFIGKNPPRLILNDSSLLSSSSVETCELRWNTVANCGYQIILVAPRQFKWNQETSELQIKHRDSYHVGDKSKAQKQHVTCAAFGFYSPTLRDGFIVVLGLERNQSMKSVCIEAKPAGTLVEKWLDSYLDPSLLLRDPTDHDHLESFVAGTAFKIDVDATVATRSNPSSTGFALDVEMKMLRYQELSW